jgi:hypothetical protein
MEEIQARAYTISPSPPPTMKGIESLFVVELLEHVGIPPLAWYWTSLPNVTILLSLYVAAFALDWLLKKTCRTYAGKLLDMLQCQPNFGFRQCTKAKQFILEMWLVSLPTFMSNVITVHCVKLALNGTLRPRLLS